MADKICWLNVGPEGRFRRSGAISSSPADLDYLVGEGLAAHDRLVIHFHGGLVPEASGRAIAEKLAAHYGDSAASIGIIWETGLIETFRDNLREVHRLKAFRKALAWILSRVIPMLADSAGLRGDTVPSDHRKIEAILDSGGGAEALDAQLAAAEPAGPVVWQRGGSADSLSEEEIADALEIDLASDPDLLVLVETGAEGGDRIATRVELDMGAKGIATTFALARFLARVILAVRRRYREGSHHDAVPTAVEELLRAAYLADVGKYAWDNMKRKSLEMWTDDGDRPDMESHVGGYFLRGLERLGKARPEVRVDLVGHSAGSIALCHMLDSIAKQKRQIKVRNVIFLAPAVRLDVFAGRMVRQPAAFSRFRAFTMADAAEKRDKLVGEIYPRSLLYFISGVLEDRADAPLAGLARHVVGRTSSAGSEYDDVRKWLAAEDRLALAPTAADAPEGLRTHSARHGDFDDDMLTLESLLAMARATP